MEKAITRFAGEYHFLSNFYWIPQAFIFNCGKFYTAEHAYQYEKAVHSGSASIAHAIYNCDKPGSAKRLGRSFLLKPSWEENKVDVMKNILRAKFSIWMPDQVTRNPLATRLNQTGERELVEGNTWGDTFWGQCPLGNGENMLGKLLMAARNSQRHHFDGR